MRRFNNRNKTNKYSRKNKLFKDIDIDRTMSYLDSISKTKLDLAISKLNQHPKEKLILYLNSANMYMFEQKQLLIELLSYLNHKGVDTSKFILKNFTLKAHIYEDYKTLKKGNKKLFRHLHLINQWIAWDIAVVLPPECLINIIIE